MKIERLELNRYRGIPQKRSVESSCIGWLSCMLEQSSQRYRHTSTGSAWERVQNSKSLSAMYVKHGADTTDAWLRQPIRLNRQYLGDCDFFQDHALRESIAETLSTSTISPSKARDVLNVE